MDNPYLFQGRRWDPESKLYCYRNRYFDPGKGRFVSRDPLGLWKDVVGYGNSYTFAGNNPANLGDPYGKAVIAATVVGGATLTAAEAAAIAGTVSAAICGATKDCREAVTHAIKDIIGSIVSAVETIGYCLKNVKCKFGNHDPHHYWYRPTWGIPPWKKCWMKHLQIDCWIAGKSGSNFLKLRFPYGPCYKNKHGKGGVTH